MYGSLFIRLFPGEREKEAQGLFKFRLPLTPKEFEIIVLQRLLPLGPRELFPLTGVHSLL